jgi:hypothetical protein
MLRISSGRDAGPVRDAGRLVPWLCPYLAVWAGFALYAVSTVRSAGTDGASDLLGGMEVYSAVVAALLLTAVLAAVELLLLHHAEGTGEPRRTLSNH